MKALCASIGVAPSPRPTPGARRRRPATFTLFAFLALALGPPPAAARRDVGEVVRPLPFADVVELQSANGIVVGRFVTSMSEHVAAAFDLHTGARRWRFATTDISALSFDGIAAAALFENGTRLVTWSLASGSQMVFDLPGTGMASTLSVADGVAWIAVDAPAGAFVTSAAAGGHSPVLPCRPDRMTVSGGAVFAECTSSALWTWTAGADWKPVPVPVEAEMALLCGDTAFAHDRTGTLWRLDLTPLAEGWTAHTLPGHASGLPRPRLQCSSDGASLIAMAATGVWWMPAAQPSAARPMTLAVDPETPWTFADGSIIEAVREDARWWLRQGVIPEPVNAAARDDGRMVTPTTPSPSARARSLAWLRQQLGPAFTSKTGRPARLIDSYEDDIRAGWTYDAAVAAIAFTSAGEIDTASELLAGLEHTQDGDGGWAFAFNPDSGRALPAPRYLGSMGWAVMAFNFYEWDTGDSGFAPAARHGLAYIDRFRVRDASVPQRGAFTMGPVKVDGISAEHNANVYSALYWRSCLDGDADLRERAEAIREFFWRELWGEARRGPGHPYFHVGFRDTGRYLDAQTWTALTFGAADSRRGQLQQAVLWAEEHLRNATGTWEAHTDIVGFNESDSVLSSAKVWSEGSEGMVAALRVLGLRERAALYAAQTERYQAASGGIPYTTVNRDGWTTKPSVAGTAWFVLNRTTPARNPFRPGDESTARRQACASNDQNVASGRP